MILQELVLHSVGVYRDRQTFRLAPPSAEKPVVLLGGLNGGGKTTFLDSIQLALYGKRARCSNRGTLGYEEFLRRSIHEASSSSDGAAVELEFTHRAEGRQQVYRVQRSWTATETRVVEHLEVLRDGELDPVATEHWAELVEELMPLGISHLFFFDGEKIENLAEPAQSRELLRTAMHALLGLDLVQQLVSDLQVLERRKAVRAQSDEEQAVLGVAKDELTRLKETRELLVQGMASVQNELDRIEAKLSELDQRFREQGGELYLKRESIEVRRKLLYEELDRVQADLRELAGGAAPLCLVRDLLEEAREQAIQEDRCEQARRFQDRLLERDALILERAKRSGLPPEVLPILEGLLCEDREARAREPVVPAFLRLEGGSIQSLESLWSEGLGETTTKAGRLVESSDELKRQLHDLERQLTGVPEKDAIAELMKERGLLQKQVADARTRLETSQEELQRLEREIDHKERRLAQQLEKLVERRFDSEDDARVCEHSRRIRSTMETFRSKVVEKNLTRVEQRVLECLQQLLHKERLISRLHISPEDFSMQLRGIRGEVLPAERLSAGERQLLAVSLLWGLGQASGRTLPTVIDTPLGRLDRLHRSHLIERYFPRASQQVILLSTDEEIDERYFRKLKPWIGRSYRLRFDEAEGATGVEDGYFWEE